MDKIHMIRKAYVSCENVALSIHPFPHFRILVLQQILRSSTYLLPFYRKVYISAVSPVPKDIVIVIDRSGSMARLHGNRSLLQITIDAVTSLLDTLNENDRVRTLVKNT